MIKTLDIELNNLKYQVEIDIDDESEEQDDYCESMNTQIEIIDIYFIKKRNVYKVTNEYIWNEINSLNLFEEYIEQYGI